MRRVPERVPYLSANRRPRIQVGVPRAHRINSQSESIWQRQWLLTIRLDAVRRLQGYLPGENRYPAHPAPSALEGNRGRASAQMAAAARASEVCGATICRHGATSEDYSDAREDRGADAEAVRAQRLFALDAADIRQLD